MGHLARFTSHTQGRSVDVAVASLVSGLTAINAFILAAGFQRESVIT